MATQSLDHEARPLALQALEPDKIFESWNGTGDGDILEVLRKTFPLSATHDVFHSGGLADSTSLSFAQIEEMLKAQPGRYKYKYRSSDGSALEVPLADIEAYTSLFASRTNPTACLNNFLSNAKKESPRYLVAKHLNARRKPAPFLIPKLKKHANPYYDIWAQLCRETGFVGPLSDHIYEREDMGKAGHPIMMVLYAHFGCAPPSYESLKILELLVKSEGKAGVVEIGSGCGYWAYMLRKLGVTVNAVDNSASSYFTRWIGDTIVSDGSKYLKAHEGEKDKILLMVYAVTIDNGAFIRNTLQNYKGDFVVSVGTQNANRFTDFEVENVESWMESNLAGWELVARVAVPSFPAKDDAMKVWRRRIRVP